VDAVGVAAESPADEPTLSGVEIRQNPANARGALSVMRAVVTGNKAGLRLRHAPGRCAKARCPSRRHRLAVHLGEAPEPSLDTALARASPPSGGRSSRRSTVLCPTSGSTRVTLR